MLRLWLLVLSLVITCTARSQEHLRLRGGLAIGYRAFALPVRILDQQRDTTLIPEGTLSPWYGGTVSIDIPLVSELSSTSWIQFDVSQSTAFHRRSVVFLINGNPTQGVIAQKQTSSLSSLSAGTGILFQPAASFGMSVGVGAYFPFSMRLAVSEFVESPSGVTFVDGVAERQLPRSVHAGENVAAALLKAVVQFQQPISAYLDLVVLAHGDMAVTSPMTFGDWKPWSVGLSVQLGWKPTVQRGIPALEQSPPPAQAAPRDIMRTSRLTRDTVTIVDPWSKERTDTVWVEVKSVHVDTMSVGTIDTVLTSTHIRTERHLPHPPLFLSVVSNVDVVNTGNDSTLAVDIKIAVTADTATTTFIQIFHESNLIFSTLSAEANAVIRIVLSDVIHDIAKQKELKLVVLANVIDAVGNQHSTAPLRLEFFRSRVTSTLEQR